MDAMVFWPCTHVVDGCYRTILDAKSSFGFREENFI